jgi:hypothetical protein
MSGAVVGAGLSRFYRKSRPGFGHLLPCPLPPAARNVKFLIACEFIRNRRKPMETKDGCRF